MKRVKSSFLSKILKNLFNEVISILVIYVKSSVMRAHCMYRVSSSKVGPVRGSYARSQPLKTDSILVICDTIFKIIIMACGENFIFY